jgi:cation transport ATPase
MSSAPLPSEHNSNTTSLLIRVNTVEQQVNQVQAQLHQVQSDLRQYVPVSVNDLQLQSIRQSVDRIERDVSEIKREMGDVNAKLTKQDQEAQQRDAVQRENQDKLQIRVLWFIVASVITVLTGVLIAFLNHLIL